MYQLFPDPYPMSSSVFFGYAFEGFSPRCCAPFVCLRTHTEFPIQKKIRRKDFLKKIILWKKYTQKRLSTPIIGHKDKMETNQKPPDEYRRPMGIQMRGKDVAGHRDLQNM